MAIHKTVKWLMVVALGGLILAGAVLFGFYLIISRAMSPDELPAELASARVIKGGGFLSKKEVFKIEPKGLIKIVTDGIWTKSREERERGINIGILERFVGFGDIAFVNGKVIAAAEFGGFEFDSSGKFLRRIDIRAPQRKAKAGGYEFSQGNGLLPNLRVVKLSPDEYGFLSFGSLEGVNVFDSDGKVIWQHGVEAIDFGVLAENDDERKKRQETATDVLEAAVADIDGDGVSEYIVSKANTGVIAFNKKGLKLWTVKDDYPSQDLYILDMDGDGKIEIIRAGNSVISSEGKVLSDLESNSTEKPLLEANAEQRLRFCSIYENEFTCKDESDKELVKSDAPMSTIKKKTPKTIDLPDGDHYVDDSDDIYRPDVKLVRLVAGAPKYYAIVGPYIGIDRAMFYLYDHEGTLVYHELLSEGAKSLAVVPNQKQSEDLMIAGDKSIWFYSHK